MRLLNLSIRPKLQFWGRMSSKQTQKNLTARNSASELTNPLQMVKIPIQAFETLNSDVLART